MQLCAKIGPELFWRIFEQQLAETRKVESILRDWRGKDSL